jgi:glycerol-3-phosphate dehydrogenase (NAD(P)+)
VAGAGSWGTALATLLASTGQPVTLWARREERAVAMAEARENRTYLPGVALPPSLDVTSDPGRIDEADAALFVMPAQAAREYLGLLREASRRATLPVALCSKGLERETLAPMHRVLRQSWPEARGAVLSGPSFASDVARGLPTAVTLAARQRDERLFWLDRLSAPTFRLYGSEDLLGVELGGAVKNVLAIACGIAMGKGFGESAKAALIARGFAEFQRFGLAMGAQRETLAGLSGLGDLVLTCNSPQSRNFSLGFALGEGADAQTYLAAQNTVAEGAATAAPLVRLARDQGVEMPISEGVSAILDGKASVEQVIEGLLTRPLRDDG